MIRKSLCILVAAVHIAQCRYYETDTRILIVGRELPNDGHLRMFRSAMARKMTPVMLRVPEESEEILRVAEYLDGISFDANEIAVVTPSENYVATHDSSSLAMNVARAALLRDGDVVTALPVDLLRGRHFATHVDEEVKKAQDKLNYFKDQAGDQTLIAPRTIKMWKKAKSALHYANKLQVKQKFSQFMQALQYDSQYCAFAGLTSALRVLFRRIGSQGACPSSGGSLRSLCECMALNVSLRHDTRVVQDIDGLVFRRSDPEVKELNLIIEPLSKHLANHLGTQSDDKAFAPFTFGTFEELPYLVPNFATGNILMRESSELFLDKKLESLEARFNGSENFPIIHILVPGVNPQSDLKSFLDKISQLTYPQNKMRLEFFIENQPHANIDAILQSLREFQHGEDSKYSLIRSVMASSSDIRLHYHKSWEAAKEDNVSDYTLLLLPTVHLTDPSFIEELLKINRRAVSPMLTMNSGADFNFKADRKGDLLMDNMITEHYEDQYEYKGEEPLTFVGVLEVPFVYGALLLRRDAVKDLILHFDLCPPPCDEEKAACSRAWWDGTPPDCELNYYRNLDDKHQLIWGMMSKNIVEQGILIYMTNENIYGDIIEEAKEEEVQREESKETAGAPDKGVEESKEAEGNPNT